MKFGRAIQNGMKFVRGNFGTEKVRELNHRLGDAIGKILGGHPVVATSPFTDSVFHPSMAEAVIPQSLNS